jgi:hypothetical protein
LTGNDVQDFPRFPDTQTLTGSGEIIRTYTAACEKYSSVKTVTDFRSHLQGAASKKPYLWKYLGGYLILLYLLLFIISKIINYVQPESSVPQKLSEPEPRLQKDFYESSGQVADDTAF